MTDEEIEGYRKKLNALTAGLEAHPDKEQGIWKELTALARNVGTSTCVAYVNNTGTYERRPAHTADLIHNIHEALQTATMVNVCRTATQGYQMATQASKSASRQFWVAAGIAFLSAVAAWVAAMRT